MSIENDASLIARSLEEPSSFEAIFDRHAATVYRYLRARVGDTAADELTAETFTRAFRARERYDGRYASALPWLYAIAANQLRMHRRSEARRLQAYRRAAERDVEQCLSGDIDARLDAGALAPVLAGAVAKLGPDDREVLLLSALAELTPAEIAQALGLSGPTVRKRLHRARTRVADSLARAGHLTTQRPPTAKEVR